MSFSFVRNDVRRRFDYLSLSPATWARTALRRRRVRSYDVTSMSLDEAFASRSSDVFAQDGARKAEEVRTSETHTSTLSTCRVKAVLRRLAPAVLEC